MITLYSDGGIYGQHYSLQTTIVTPSLTRVEYRHGVPTTEHQDNLLAGGLSIDYRKIFAPSGQLLETESTFYTDLQVTSYAFVPNLQKREIIRDGRTFRTEYTYSQNNFGDYHHPNRVVETGHIVRTTDYSYSHLTTPWIPGLVTTEKVQVGTETFQRRWTYDSLGFKTSEVGWYRPSQASEGVVTTYSPDQFGNVATKIRVWPDLPPVWRAVRLALRDALGA